MKKWTTRALAMLLLVFTFVAALCGCSSTNPNGTAGSSASTPIFSENGFIVGPGGFTCTVEDPNMVFSYTTLSENEYDKTEFDKNAQLYVNLVREWWNDDETFIAPSGIIPVTFENGPRGFAKDGYIFINPFHSDAFITVVHETIHLQNDRGLRDASNNGYAINEMIVEDITVRLLGKDFFGCATDEGKFFKSCPNLVCHREYFESAFKNKDSAEDVYEKLYGEDWRNITSIFNNWSNLPNMMNTSELEIFCNTYLGITPSQLDDIYKKIDDESRNYYESLPAVG